MDPANGLLEASVQEALFKLAPQPRVEDALLALWDPDVQDVTLQLAQRMREIAREEDEQRAVEGKSLVNYRHFYVGGVGIGLIHVGGGLPYEWWVFPAYNSKPSRKACKYCAEMRIIRASHEVPCTCIGGLVVVGENQPDGKSGKLRKTLDPCGDCRDLMRHPDNRSRFRRKTLILTAKPLSQIPYVEPLYKMMAAHNETWP